MPTPRDITIALVGDKYNHDEPAHPRIESLVSALAVNADWVPTTSISASTDFSAYDGIWVVPGAPYRSHQGIHHAIRFARNQGKPFLGTCGGFYGAVLEYAQNELGLEETSDLRDDLSAIESLIVPPTCSVNNNQRVPLTLRQGSLLSHVYGGRTEVDEVLQCEYGMVQEFLDKASRRDIRFSAWDESQAPRALEIPTHPFFVACLFQPELSSTGDSLHPVVEAFLNAVRRPVSVGTQAVGTG